MESLNDLIDGIKSAVKEGVREVVREELRAVQNVDTFVLTVTYGLGKDFIHPNPNEAFKSEHLLHTKPKCLHCMGVFPITAWNQLIPQLHAILGKPNLQEGNKSAPSTWDATINFLTDDCGYTCSPTEHKLIDGYKVQAVSVTARMSKGR